ncbi:MAG: glycosyltransferase family 39 protein, partial [Actinomycetota bacterium]|nr:glycosyltransferase family 39 protein [Actinomycetota bacterium]
MARAAVALITLLGGIRRFATLDDQSIWRDEALTVWQSSMGLGDMLAKLPDAEGHPPLYPLLEWAMVHAFGDGELAVRTLSALAGTAAIPVLYAAARTLASPRAGLIAAALLAASPFHLWYSQEARPYALMILLAAISFLAFAKLTTAPERRWVVVWAVASSLALATHYFSAFLLVPEALWLLRTVPIRRAVALGVGALAATGAALLPLLLDQRGDSDALWVKGAAGTLRLRGIAEDLLLGPEVHRTAAFALAVLVLAGAAAALIRAAPDERRPVLVTAGLLAAGLAIPVLLKLADLDYMLSRYVAVLLVPLLVTIALALAVRAAGVAGLAGAAVLCAAMLAMGALAETDDDAQREDWR